MNALLLILYLIPISTPPSIDRNCAVVPLLSKWPPIGLIQFFERMVCHFASQKSVVGESQSSPDKSCFRNSKNSGGKMEDKLGVYFLFCEFNTKTT